VLRYTLKMGGGVEIEFDDRAAADAAIKAVRNNDDPTNWCFFEYGTEKSRPNLLLPGKTGTGGMEEMRGCLTPDTRGYGLIRVEDVVDLSLTFKFILILWAGAKVKVVPKARMATHKGSLLEFIGQHHHSIDAGTLEEVSDDIIRQRVTDASGSGSRVKDVVYEHQAPYSDSVAPAPVAASLSQAESQGQTSAPVPEQQQRAPKTSSFKGSGPSVPKGSQGFSLSDESAMSAAIASVRNDRDPTTWALFSYSPESPASGSAPTSSTLYLNATGTGSITEITQHLDETSIGYALYRTTDQFDMTTNVKFVYIQWIGDKVKVVRKARIATHKGALRDFFGQYHVDVDVSNATELSDDIIREKVQFAAGTASHLRD